MDESHSFVVLLCLFLLFDVHLTEQLMQAEEKGTGAVAWPVYAAYIKAAGGPLAFIVNILLFLFTTGSIAFSNWWLSHWIRQGSGVNQSHCFDFLPFKGIVQPTIRTLSSVAHLHDSFFCEKQTENF